jgi:protein TonB
VIKREKNVLGQSVYVNIIIGKSGSVIEHKIIKGVSPQLDKETLRLIKSMPPWKPGMIKGKPVKVSKTIEVRYKMN